ncbi:MAG TPA: zinc ribbon domain-containing protein [Clostridia bacterium]|jgi:ribosomal protein L40E|nr:zinc ribbon domain-containing protein [Clostridia bacterium]
MAKKQNKKIPPVILLLIYACLLFAIYISLSTLALGLWGQTIMGTVDTYHNRLDNTDGEMNRSRTIFKGYYFTVDGKEYRGHVMYNSDEAWPGLEEGETRSELISYFSFFPYINKPAALTDFDQMGARGLLYHLLAPPGCVFLIFLVTGTLKARKKSKKGTQKVAAHQNHIRGDANMFCQNCGNGLPEGAVFCSKCGVKVQQHNTNICSACESTLPEDAAFCIGCGTAVNIPETPLSPPQSAGSASPQRGEAQGTGLVGFSALYNSPEILEAAQKNRQSSIGCMGILVFVPLLGFPVAGLFIDEFPFGESVVIGAGIALVMLIVNLFALRRAKQPMWEGVVVNKFSKERSEHKGGEDENYRTYTEYTTVFCTDTGKEKKLTERDSQRDMYDYLAVGDRVRYHPKFGTYEKYDKSKDRIIYCNVCSMMNPIQNDRCKRCDNLLFK